MKKIYLFALLLLFILSGCSDIKNTNNLMETTREEFVTVSNPFENNSSLVSPNETIAVSFNVCVNKSDYEYLEYNDNYLTIPLTMQNAAIPIELGMFVFVDGILQNYSSDISEEKSSMQIFSLNENEISAIELYINDIKAVETWNDTLVEVICIVNPNFTPTAGNLREIASHAGDMAVVIPIKAKTVSPKSAINIQKECDNHPITEEEAKRFGFNIEPESSSINFMLTPYGEKSRPQGVIAATSDGKLKLELCEYSRNYPTNTYRISIYKNHEKINFNNGYEYIDIEVKDKYIAYAEINIENVRAGDFIYCTAVPIGTDSSEIRGKKYETIPILSLEEMPDPVDDDDLFFEVIPDETNYITETEVSTENDNTFNSDVYSKVENDWIQVSP